MNSDFFSHSRSRSLTLPIVISVPHAGLRVPEIRKELMQLPRSVFLRDVDYRIDEIWRPLADELDLSFIKSEVHRYAIDLNRAPTQVEGHSVQGLPKDEAKKPKGLFWIESTRGESLGGSAPFAPLSREVYTSLVDAIHTPYYAFIHEELERVKARFGYAIFIDGHSMPSKGTSFHADPNSIRADLVPGDDQGRACAPAVLQAAMETAATHGFSMRPNDPYSGGNITRHFGRPADGIHALQIEVNRHVYLRDEEDDAKDVLPEGQTRLKTWARSFLQALARLQMGP